MSDFPTKENPQDCKNGCGTKIYLSNKNDKRKWLPYELDGEFHECPNKPGLDKFNREFKGPGSYIATFTEQEQGVKLTPIEEKDLTVPGLLEILAKAGFHIDIKTIMKQDKERFQEEQK